MEPVSAVLGAATWIVNLALDKLKADVLKAWADSNEMGAHVRQLEAKLLDAQGVLGVAEKKKLDNAALEELLRQLREVAYEAENVLDELEYFRIQDEVEGTREAALDDADFGGVISGTTVHARHAARAVAGKWLPCSSSCFHPAPDSVDDGYATEVLQGPDGVSGSRRSSRRQARCGGWFCGLRSAPTRHTPQATAMSVPTQHARSVEIIDTTEEPHKLEFNRVEISGRMQGIVQKLEPTCRSAKELLNLQLAACPRGSPLALIDENIIKSRETTHFPAERKFIGREEEKKEIIGQLTSAEFANRNLSVLPIWGYGGLGKTTLARHVYNDTEVVGMHFPVKVWICVGLQFNVLRICRDMLSAIPKDKEETDNEPQTIDQFQQLILKRLKSNKFLIVLDDIWDRQDSLEHLWNKLLAPLKHNTRQANGNVVLVTTRSPEVANVVKDTTNPIELQGLKPTEFWSLFLECVFRGENFAQYQTLLTIARKNIKKLRGFPLAAVTVGALLRKGFTIDHWLQVLENDEWKLQEGGHDIMPALKLSYNCLPFHLQKCFSYCALFPDDYEFDSKELVHLWIALDTLYILRVKVREWKT